MVDSIDEFPVNHRRQHVDLFDHQRIHLERVIFRHDDVGPLADFEAAALCERQPRNKAKPEPFEI